MCEIAVSNPDNFLIATLPFLLLAGLLSKIHPILAIVAVIVAILMVSLLSLRIHGIFIYELLFVSIPTAIIEPPSVLELEVKFEEGKVVHELKLM